MAEPEVISHWNTLVEGLQVSPVEFYNVVEAAIVKRQVPDCKISRIALSEGGIFSASREYLRVTRNDFKFDICAAPFGSGFFVSSWLLHEVSGFIALLASIPVVGLLFMRFIKPLTYYQVDVANMFQSSVHAALLETVDRATQAKGLRLIPEADRKPVMKEFFAR